MTLSTIREIAHPFHGTEGSIEFNITKLNKTNTMKYKKDLEHITNKLLNPDSPQLIETIYNENPFKDIPIFDLIAFNNIKHGNRTYSTTKIIQRSLKLNPDSKEFQQWIQQRQAHFISTKTNYKFLHATNNCGFYDFDRQSCFRPLGENYHHPITLDHLHLRHPALSGGLIELESNKQTTGRCLYIAMIDPTLNNISVSHFNHYWKTGIKHNEKIYTKILEQELTKFTTNKLKIEENIYHEFNEFIYINGNHTVTLHNFTDYNEAHAYQRELKTKLRKPPTHWIQNSIQ